MHIVYLGSDFRKDSLQEEEGWEESEMGEGKANKGCIINVLATVDSGGLTHRRPPRILSLRYRKQEHLSTGSHCHWLRVTVQDVYFPALPGAGFPQIWQKI